MPAAASTQHAIAGISQNLITTENKRKERKKNVILKELSVLVFVLVFSIDLAVIIKTLCSHNGSDHADLKNKKGGKMNGNLMERREDCSILAI